MSIPALTTIEENALRDLRKLLWGSRLQDEVFSRWSQGFLFSQEEPTALVQLEGGPCAVMAPVQAFIVKTILFSQESPQNLLNASEEEVTRYLCDALAEILVLMKTGEFIVVCFENSREECVPGSSQGPSNPPSSPSVQASGSSASEAVPPSTHRPVQPQDPGPGPCNNSASESTESTRPRLRPSDPPAPLPVQASVSEVNMPTAYEAANASLQSETPSLTSQTSRMSSSSVLRSPIENGASSPKRRKNVDQEDFHARLRCLRCTDEASMRITLKKYLSVFREDCGVLLYLYSLLLTKGLEQIKNEMEDTSEPLIDGTHGHGSQSLINLMITGRAVTNVWDNDKELGGLTLRGIQEQATIGFLTVLEHLRYCEVGWFLKNPMVPIWMLGSETHLSILFAEDQSLVVRESPAQNAKTVFSRFDPEGNGFISTSLLADVMSELDLVSEKEYVALMVNKMDAEQLGIITLNSFMTEFFPEAAQSQQSMEFNVYHYNGLARSCPDGKVKYWKGTARLEDDIEVQILTDVSPMKNCLQTKWPSIELQWTDNHIPSLN